MGVPMRDVKLPQVNSKYASAVLSLANLCQRRGAPITIPESLIEQQYREFVDYTSAAIGFRSFLFHLGVSVDGFDEVDAENGDSTKALVETETRKLFKLGGCRNAQRGAPGRLPTAYGSFASARDQYLTAVRVEEVARENAIAKENRRLVKEIALEREKPVLAACFTAGYMKHGEKLTKGVLVAMFMKNKALLRDLGLKIASSRSDMVDALVKRASQGGLQVMRCEGNRNEGEPADTS